MSEMTAMDAAVSILYDEGVRCIFGIPGAGILPFYQSLRNFGKIRHMVARHGEGSIHMADGMLGSEVRWGFAWPLRGREPPILSQGPWHWLRCIPYLCWL